MSSQQKSSDDSLYSREEALDGLEISKILGIKTYLYDIYTVAEMSKYSEAIRTHNIKKLRTVPCRCRPLEELVCPKCSFLRWYEKINEKKLI